MPEFIMTKGLPASGKSTWAKKHVNERQGWVRISNDELRTCFFNRVFSKQDTKHIENIRATMINYALEKKLNIVVDNTNLAPRHEEAYRNLCAEHGYRFQVKSFLDVPVEECIRRDKLRPNPVRSGVILDMYNRFVNTEAAVAIADVPKPKYHREPAFILEQDKTLPEAILCDLDGTLALIEHRDPYNAENCNEDGVNEPVLAVVKAMQAQGKQIIFLSGRMDCYEGPTRQFLREKCGLTDYILLMRKTDDYRKDNIIKREIFENNIFGQWYVRLVLDDRKQVVDMWREIGLVCMQVAPGDF